MWLADSFSAMRPAAATRAAEAARLRKRLDRRPPKPLGSIFEILLTNYGNDAFLVRAASATRNSCSLAGSSRACDFQRVLRRTASFAYLRRLDVVHEDAHHISGHRRNHQHAIVRHGVAIVFGLLHAGDDVVWHRAQLDRGW